MTDDAWIPPAGPPPDPSAVAGANLLGTRYLRSQLGNLPRVSDLVAGVMSTPTAVLLIGPYGAGKTAFVDSIGFSVATGMDWLGRPVKRCRVLAVVGEGANGRHPRLGALEYAWNDGRSISDDDLVTIVKPASLAKKSTWQQLVEYAVAEDFGLVTLETLSSLAPDADETKDAALIMRNLSDLATAINGTALLSHHPGWGPKDRARGGYQLEANADEVLILSGSQDTSVVSITRKKVKDGPSGKTIWLNRKPILDSVVLEHARASDAELPLRQRIIACLDAMADIGATGPQLMDECGVDPKTGRGGFYKALNPLVGEEITSAGPRGRTRYWLTRHAPREDDE